MEPYKIRDSGSDRGLGSYWGKWLHCTRAAVFGEREKLARAQNKDMLAAVGMVEDDYVPEPKIKKNGSVTDDAAWIGVLAHGMMDSWASGKVTLPSQTVFAPHARNSERSIFVASTITDNAVRHIGSPKLLGSLVGCEVEVWADGSLWGDVYALDANRNPTEATDALSAVRALGMTSDETGRPFSGIDDLVTYLDEKQAATLRMLTMNDTIKPGLTIWDWKTMGYLYQAAGHTSGYQHHAYCYATGHTLGEGPIRLDDGTATQWYSGQRLGYPANFIYVCIERGTGVAPKIDQKPLFIRKEDPDKELDRELVRSYILQAARRRASCIEEVRLDLCVDKYNQPCRWGPGPGARGLCNQKPGLTVIE